MDAFPPSLLVNAGGLILGVVFGGLVQRSDFCTMGAISDWALLGDTSRFRAWALAIGVAILGTQGLELAGLIDLSKSIYTGTKLNWAGALLGGLLFGFGMTQAGGCGSRTLARLGAGNIKSLVVMLMIGIFAYIAMRGLAAPARLAVENATSVDLGRGQGLPVLAGAGSALRAALALLIGGGLVAWSLASARFRKRGWLVAAGIGIGLIAAGGWAVTGILGADEFEPLPLASVTFVAPIGDSLVYLMTYTGAALGFGPSTVAGVILGAFLAAKAEGRFRLEGFTNTGDLLRHLGGGALMGFGGVLALGCTVGQGITGLSTLALGSVIAFAGIVIGGLLGIRYLEEGNLGAAFRALLPSR